ncbi:MAG: hypothetical protein JW715_01085 [Sedimentisphaerales bacterium]|nr:hypothetical protein [Sedimentisphaerales bacterium]
MQGTVLAIGIICSILVVTLRPKNALVVYITALLWFPDYLRVSIGTIDISVGRIIVTVLFIRCLNNDLLRSRFEWSQLDKWVALSMVVYVGMTLLTQPTFASIENRGGFLIDTWLTYMTARFIITDKETIIHIIKCISIALIPLAILGCIECLAGWQPFVPLKRFRPWNPTIETEEIEREMRWGFTRAVGPFSHSILFGCGFAMFLPLIYHLRYEKNYWKRLAYIFSATNMIGALSSMSSGPWVMTIVVIFCLLVERYKKWLKTMLKLLILACIGAELLSNRTLYHVIFSYAGRLGGAGWFRARLIDAAIDHFGEWWLAGYGGKDPGWGHYFGMSFTDVTNEFILSGVLYGLAGLMVLCIVLFVAFRNLISAHKKATSPASQSMYWALGCILFSVAVVWMSISFFGQLVPLFYFILGLIGSSSLFPAERRNRIVKVLKVNNLKNVACVSNP